MQGYISDLVSYTGQQHLDNNHLRQHQSRPHQTHLSNIQPAYNKPELYQSIPTTRQQQSYNNANNYQLPKTYQPALYQPVQTTTHKQQSYNNVNNYVTPQYGHGDGYYSENSDNIEHFLPAQTTQNNVDDKATGLHTNELYHTEYENLVSQSAASVVTKHIYFHVAPADPEEHSPPAPDTSRSVKKVYNIVFIKVPSQGAGNAVQLQQILANQQNLVEDKTLVYILVNKPEPQPQVPIMPVNSQHEVST